MITEEKIAEFQRRMSESVQLYKMLPDVPKNRDAALRDIENIGMDVMGSDWPEFRNWVNVDFNDKKPQAKRQPSKAERKFYDELKKFGVDVIT